MGAALVLCATLFFKGLRANLAPVTKHVQLLVCLAVLVGCGKPTEGPERVAYDYLNALLTPETRTRMANLLSTLTRTRDLIVKHYPASKRAVALEAAGVAQLKDAGTPEALFAKLIGLAGAPANMGGIARFAMRPKETLKSENVTNVRTWGGDNVELVQVADRWHVALSADDHSRLQKIEAMAERNLSRVDKAVDSVKSQKFGSSQK